jgi:hypothetical protein
MTNKIHPSIQTFLNNGSSGLVRMPPQPRNTLGASFRSILSGVANMMGDGVGAALSGTLDPTYSNLIGQQIAMQQQMQLVSLHSNIEKSRHESKMAAIRNVRAG